MQADDGKQTRPRRSRHLSAVEILADVHNFHHELLVPRRVTSRPSRRFSTTPLSRTTHHSQNVAPVRLRETAMAQALIRALTQRLRCGLGVAIGRRCLHESGPCARRPGGSRSCFVLTSSSLFNVRDSRTLYLSVHTTRSTHTRSLARHDGHAAHQPAPPTAHFRRRLDGQRLREILPVVLHQCLLWFPHLRCCRLRHHGHR